MFLKSFLIIILFEFYNKLTHKITLILTHSTITKTPLNIKFKHMSNPWNCFWNACAECANTVFAKVFANEMGWAVMLSVE